jgi:hypothetical protein
MVGSHSSITLWSLSVSSITFHPGHICYGSSTAQWKLPHGNANVEQEHELLEYALTSRLSCGTLEAWICKAQTAYILRSQELGGTLRRC